MPNNDDTRLEPKTEFDGRALEYDLPSVHVGVAEYDEGPTGCTVLHFPEGASCEIDVRGGAAGIVGDWGFFHAICLAGGSLLGLEATAGVAAELFAKGGYKTEFFNIPLASGGIVYDFGSRPGSAVYPDKELGRAALSAARHGRIPLGRRGAGRSVSVGKGFEFDRAEPGGQGAAFRSVGPTKLLFLTVVNAIGAIVDREGRVVRGHLDRSSKKREPMLAELERRIAAGARATAPAGNTTLSVLVTNQRTGLRQLARSVHSSMARAIQPFHTPDDGDTLWAVSTNEVDNPALPVTALSLLAGELAWDAVLSCFE